MESNRRSRREYTDLVTSPSVLLFDSMIVIEAVRTACWNAITGRRKVVTVETCADELRGGNPSAAGYVPVSEEQLARVTVEPLSPVAKAAFRLRYPSADGMDAGERDLLALATTRTDEFQICSCDKAAVRAAHALGWIDRVVSLESLAVAVGARPNPALRAQFSESRLSEWRTKLQLGTAL